jgi:two-component system sensor histidine kinase KdpD
VDLVLLDVMLPDLDGLALCRQVRAREPEIYLPIIMLTALAGEKERQAGFAADADDYVTKPVDFNELRARVAVWLRTRQRLRAAHEQLLREHELRRLRERTEELQAALLSSVSHDLRTPLAAIKAAVTNLLDDTVAWRAGDRGDLLRAIDEETDRLTRYVSRLLDLSRIEAGAVQPRRDWHDVEEILAGVVERLDPRGDRVLLAVRGELPVARVDYLLVEQVIANLVENALKYAPAAEPVEVAAALADGTLAIAVADRGPGVPPDEAARIFEKFYRLAGDGGAPGTGLGLAIARGLARAHGGDVTLAARPGGGSVFSVYLPVEAGGTELAEPCTAPVS